MTNSALTAIHARKAAVRLPEHDLHRRSVVALISGILAFAIPLVIGVYWPIYSLSQGTAIALLRPSILAGSLLLGALWHHVPLSTAEVQLTCVLGILTAVLLIPSLTATDPARALAVWLKLAVLCVIALLLSRALRDARTAKWFGAGLIFASMTVGIFTVLTYVHFIGFVTPTYRLTREFKGIAERTGIPLNAIPFTSVFSFLAGVCLVRASASLWVVGFALFVVSTALTGSRAPLGVLLLSACGLALLNALQSRRLFLKLSAFMVAVSTPVVIMLLMLKTPFKTMSSLTEGRWDLWYVAVEKFKERPMLGFGFDSWHDDLVSMLPGAYSLTRYMAKSIVGGYHNEYLGLLAEQGLIGFVPAMLLVFFLFYLCWKGAFYGWQTWRGGQWALFTCLFLLFRAGVEVPGLFGEGSEPADYLAYIFVAIVASRFSTEEDFLRATLVSHETGRN